jgi:hypothetical protein
MCFLTHADVKARKTETVGGTKDSVREATK